jgi:hypothetical protein
MAATLGSANANRRPWSPGMREHRKAGTVFVEQDRVG